jgi:hypothetical protein
MIELGFLDFQLIYNSETKEWNTPYYAKILKLNFRVKERFERWLNEEPFQFSCKGPDIFPEGMEKVGRGARLEQLYAKVNRDTIPFDLDEEYENGGIHKEVFDAIDKGLDLRYVFEPVINEILDNWENETELSYTEWMKIDNPRIRSIVAGMMDVGEMMDFLGTERYKTAGEKVIREQYDAEGNLIGTIDKHVVYEVHKVDITKLLVDGVEGDVLGDGENIAWALKCWCTTTDEEHWLWLEGEEYKDDPLAAVASTCRIEKEVIPHITAIKRQGDIFFFELTDEGSKVSEEVMGQDKVPLTKEQYFDLLVAES